MTQFVINITRVYNISGYNKLTVFDIISGYDKLTVFETGYCTGSNQIT